MKKLTGLISKGDVIAEMHGKINELIDEIEELKIQLTRTTKQRPDPRGVNPYNTRKR